MYYASVKLHKKYKVNNRNLYLANVNYVCVKKAPDCTKMCQIKCKKYFFRWHVLDPSSLSCAKHADITSPSTLPLHLISPTLGQKPERHPVSESIVKLTKYFII